MMEIFEKLMKYKTDELAAKCRYYQDYLLDAQIFTAFKEGHTMGGRIVAAPDVVERRLATCESMIPVYEKDIALLEEEIRQIQIALTTRPVNVAA